MSVTSETLRLLNGLRNQLQTVTDQQTRDLVAAWASAWDEVSADLNAALLDLLQGSQDGMVTRAAVMRSGRLLNALTVVQTNLDTLAKEAGLRITADLAQVVDDAGRTQAALVDSQLPPYERGRLAGWERVDPAQIAAIVRRSTQQITSRTWPLSSQATTAVRAELIRGIAAGSNPRETARRMVARAEGRFNGGLTRALVISRTETLDAHRAAAALGQAQQADVLTGWVWLAKLDARTCPSCWAQSGQLHPLDEPGPLDHQQGRCARMPKTRTWADLGFTGLDEPPDITPNAQDLFDSLPPADQVAILGRTGWDAYVNGHFPMHAWSQRRSTDGWRDAFYASKPPSAGRLPARLAS